MKLDQSTLTLLGLAGFLAWYFWPQLKGYVAPAVTWGKGLLAHKSNEKINPLTEAWGVIYQEANAKGNAKLKALLTEALPLLLDGKVTPPEAK